MEARGEQLNDDLRGDVEGVLVEISRARVRAEEVAEALAAEGAEEGLVTSLNAAAGAIAAEYRRLVGTSGEVSERQARLDVEPLAQRQQRLAV